MLESNAIGAGCCYVSVYEKGVRGRSTCAGSKEKSKARVFDAFGRGGEEDGDGGLSGRWDRDFLFYWFCHACLCFLMREGGVRRVVVGEMRKKE